MLDFSRGYDFIDTKKDIVVTVFSILEAFTDLYVVGFYNDKGDMEYYITDEDSLIQYDKYYWD